MLRLLARPSFRALIVTQFLGAFNDNAFKQLVLLLTASAVSAEALPWVAESGLAVDSGGAHRSGAVAFLFALPFVLLCTTTGALADRFSKSRIIKLANALEILVMGVALAALVLESYAWLLATVFCMGAQSALFGPSKYGSIRELVSARDMSRATALIQSTTTLAILLGIALAGTLAQRFGDRLWVPGIAFVGFAALGFLTSLPIERLPARQPERRIRWNVLGEARSQWRSVRGDRLLVAAVLGSAYYYFVAALLLLVTNDFGLYGLGLDKERTSYLMAPVVLGIAIAAILAGKVSGDRIEGGLVPLGVLGMALPLFALGLGPRDYAFALAMLFLLGLASGAGSLPIRTLVQVLPGDERRGAVLGFSQTMDFVGILAAGPAFTLLQRYFEPRAMMVAVGVMLLAALVPACMFALHHAIRLLLWLFVHTSYRVHVRGRERLPEAGGALLVANHQSYVDALLISAVSPRPVRYLMYRPYFELPLLGWFARRMRAIPVASGDSPEAREGALGAAAEAARSGELVCIFAEGGITRSGHLMSFAGGMERIARDAGVPIVPVSLDRLWGSLFSPASGRPWWRRLRLRPYRVDLRIGTSLPPDASAFATRLCIQEGIAELRSERKGRRGSLAWRFLHQARTHARSPAVACERGGELDHRGLSVAALGLRSALRARLADASTVAVLLPPGADGVLANVALALGGWTSVPLDPSLDDAELAEMCEAAGARFVVTSRRFLAERGRGSPLPQGRTIELEDAMGAVSPLAAAGRRLASYLPAAFLADRCAPPERGEAASEAVATVLFAGRFAAELGGGRKAVMLTHSNVLSNTQSLLQVVALGPGDAVLGCSPFSDAFGYTVTLWAALLSGARAVYPADPFDAESVGRLVERHGVTVMLGTPATYAAYLRGCRPEQLASVRLAMCDARGMEPGLADAWRERFGGELLAGYGCTELSPVVSANLPTPADAPARRRLQERGTVGLPLPGVAVRIVDPATGAPAGEGEEGRIEVKGPSVMQGYLGRPDATAAVLRDGWFATGDAGRIERSGFLRLSGERDSRTTASDSGSIAE